MTVHYALELWRDVGADIAALAVEHWKEIALDRDTIPLDIDIQGYQFLEDFGMLHVVTVRDNRALIGYYISIIRTHLHYASTLMAYEDVYYLAPAYRRGTTGYRLFLFVESCWRERGVQKAIATHKLHFQTGRVRKLFQRLGWTQTEELYTKMLR